MKTLIQKTLLMASIAMAFVNAQAHQELGPNYGYRADLETIRLHSNHDQGYNTHGGEVVISMAKSEVSLTVYQSIDCPPDMACIALAPAPMRITLPLVSVDTTTCGDVVYRAVKNNMPADGALETLTVTDHTQNQCPHLMMLPATAISYSTYYMSWIPEEPNQEATSFFTAKPLEAIEWTRR